MGTFQEVTTSTMERGNSTLRGLDTVRSLQSTRGFSIRLFNTPKFTFGMRPELYFCNYQRKTETFPFYHLRFSFCSLKPAPARVVVVSLR